MENLWHRSGGYLKTRYKSIIAWSAVFIGFYVAGLFIPKGFDWNVYYSQGTLHPIWTPWTYWVLKVLNWPLLVAITLWSIVYRTYHYNKSPWPMLLALLSMPTLWVIFMGNLDGLVLFGLIVLPWGIPLALLKPQLTFFAMFAKKSSFFAAAIFGVLTLVIWGFWPANFLMVLQPAWKVEWTQDISLFPWGLLIALPLLWFSRGDEDLLMAAGSFATPHLFPYHFVLIMPAMARMSKPWMVLTFLFSWTPFFAANYFGSEAWHMGNLLAAVFWIGLYLSKRVKKAALAPSANLELGT